MLQSAHISPLGEKGRQNKEKGDIMDPEAARQSALNGIRKHRDALVANHQSEEEAGLFGLTDLEFRIADYLYRHPEPVSADGLAAHFDTTTKAGEHSLELLEALGFIERTPDSTYQVCDASRLKRALDFGTKERLRTYVCLRGYLAEGITLAMLEPYLPDVSPD